MARQSHYQQASRRPGKFLLSKHTQRTNAFIYFLSWASLFLVLGMVLFEADESSLLRWLVLVSFLNTVAIGLSHREMMRLTIEQELEIIESAKSRPGALRPSMERTESLFEDPGRQSERQDVIKH